MIARMASKIRWGLIAHHALDELETWSQGMVDVSISICWQAYKELRLKVPGEQGVTPAKANLDIGAQMCLGDLGWWTCLGKGRLWLSLPS